MIGIETDRGLWVAALLERELADAFMHQPDAEILRSLPGLGIVLGARVLAEFGDSPNRYKDAKARRCYAGTAPITRTSGARPTPATSGPSQPSPPHPARDPSTTANADAERPTTRPCERSPTGSSASSTAASTTTSPTTKRSPGRTPSPQPLDSYARGMSRCRGLRRWERGGRWCADGAVGPLLVVVLDPAWQGGGLGFAFVRWGVRV